MNLAPASLRDLSRGLAHAFALGEKVEDVDLRALNRVVEYVPEDMTVSVEAGVTVAELQRELAKARQWLPVDPPNPDRLTIESLLATNATGPRRYGNGTVRDYVIGLKVALADGTNIKSGGKVVKNVAGYDLAKLFIGSRRSLGVVFEVTFKLRPLPEKEQVLSATCESLAQAGERIEAVLATDLAPTVFDLHNHRPQAPEDPPPLSVVVGFAGNREEVDWQTAKAGELGFTAPDFLDYDRDFRAESNGIQRRSVLPSQTVDVIRGLGPVRFVARAGNGVIYYRGGPAPPRPESPAKLSRRLKDAFDPKRILPDLTL
jgi:FAD/FMN-containing dehydrogenase